MNGFTNKNGKRQNKNCNYKISKYLIYNQRFVPFVFYTFKKELHQNYIVNIYSILNVYMISLNQ
jgi:hypothetical protein